MNSESLEWSLRSVWNHLIQRLEFNTFIATHSWPWHYNKEILYFLELRILKALSKRFPAPSLKNLYVGFVHLDLWSASVHVCEIKVHELKSEIKSDKTYWKIKTAQDMETGSLVASNHQRSDRKKPAETYRYSLSYLVESVLQAQNLPTVEFIISLPSFRSILHRTYFEHTEAGMRWTDPTLQCYRIISSLSSLRSITDYCYLWLSTILAS